MEQQSEVAMFTRLGLTPAQARVFIALIQSGVSTAKEISKNSKVARSDVYRVMATLEKLGLIERTISAPCKFSAVPVQDALLILMKRRKEETCELQAIAKEILKKLKKSSVAQGFKEFETEFILVPPSKPFINRIRTAIDGAQESLDLLLSLKRLSEGLGNAFKENFDGACARNVHMRFIVEHPLKGRAEENAIKFIRKSPLCQIRFVPQCPRVIMGIYDKIGLSLVINPEANLSGSPALWSNSQSLLIMAQEYFEILWITAMDNPVEVNENASEDRKS